MELAKQIVTLLVIGFAAGFVATRALRLRIGIIGALVLGVIGAFVGHGVFVAANLPHAHFVFVLLAALAGSFAIALVMRLFARRHY